MRAVVLGALLSMLGCGRVSFDVSDVSAGDAGDAGDAAVPCVGDLLVDTADDNAALNCQGAGCSLRAALAIAGTRATTKICFADRYTITTAPRLDVTAGDVTIDGNGSSICGGGANRVFRVAVDAALRLRKVTVCHGRTTDEPGAGVFADTGSVLDLDEVVFDDNVVTSDVVDQEGGAIHASYAATVTIRRSRFSNNQVINGGSALGYARGGGIAIYGDPATQVVIEDTAFDNNRTDNVGGALFLAMDLDNATVNRVLFANNVSPRGAAIDVNCAATNRLTITSSTFADNTQQGLGVIYICDTQIVRLEFCSVTTSNGPVVFTDPGAQVELHGNAFKLGTFDICAGTLTGTSLGDNVSDRDDTICALNDPTDKLADPQFEPLADNAGFTATLALAPSSPAIDAAGTTCPSTDQRGKGRPLGPACDAGAFERQ